MHAFLRSNRNRLIVTGYLLVVVLGCIDYLTGDYSMLLFYMLPVILVSWLQGHRGALLVSLLSGGSRFLSDYYTSSASAFKYSTSLQDMVFLLLIGFLVPVLKRLMTEDGQPQ